MTKSQEKALEGAHKILKRIVGYGYDSLHDVDKVSQALADIEAALSPQEADQGKALEELKQDADRAYCDALDIADKNCRGSQWKIENGKFGNDDLKWHCQHHEKIGFHRGIHHALRCFSAQPPAYDVNGELLAIAAELDGEFDKQTYDEKMSHDFDPPDDAEFCVNITSKQLGRLSKAISRAEAAMKPACEGIDIDQSFWESITQAAMQSDWIPEQYTMNDWVSDVCEFLRHRKSREDKP